MLKKIRNRIFAMQAGKQLKTVEREKKFVSYDKAKSILLLFESTYSERNPGTKRIIETLLAEGKKVVAWGFVDKKQITSAVYPEYRILHSGDLNLLHKPKQALLNELSDQEFDLVIDITHQQWLALSYVVLYANAKCKTGMQKQGPVLYDFAVDIDSYLEEKNMNADDLPFTFLYDQIIFYLKNIQTND
jgi:hypothetical protein